MSDVGHGRHSALEHIHILPVPEVVLQRNRTRRRRKRRRRWRAVRVRCLARGHKAVLQHSQPHLHTHTHSSHSCLWPCSFSQAAVNGSSQTSGIKSSPIMGVSGMHRPGADSTSASSLETDTGTLDKHLMGKDRVSCPSTVSICLSLSLFHSLFPPRSRCPSLYLQCFSFTIAITIWNVCNVDTARFHIEWNVT